jgi:hypothetical protein
VNASGPTNRISRGRNEIRAAIKAGDFRRVRDLFSSTSFEPDPLLEIAAQNYNTAGKHTGHTGIVDFRIGQGARPSCGQISGTNPAAVSQGSIAPFAALLQPLNPSGGR